jgi:hypothetical protein
VQLACAHVPSLLSAATVGIARSTPVVCMRLVWSSNRLMGYVLMQAALDHARRGTLVSAVLHVDEAPVPAEVLGLALSCLEPDPSKRVDANALLANLECMLASLNGGSHMPVKAHC